MIYLKKRLMLFFLICALGYPLSGHHLWAQMDESQKTLEVVGTGRIFRDDVAKARDEAIAQGLWDIVEKGVELIIPPSSVVANFQLLSDRVYSRPEEFIHDYKVLTESKSGRYYRVVVQATVTMETLQDTLKEIGVLVTAKALPRVLLLLTEKNIGAMDYKKSWDQIPFAGSPLTTEVTLEQLLAEKGVVVVKPEFPETTEMAKPEDDIPPFLTDKEALQWGLDTEADVVIIGQADAHFSGNVLGTDMQSIEASFSVRALRVDDGSALGAFETTKVAVNSDQVAAESQALAEAATAMAETLNKEIATRWSRDASRTLLVELVVQGIEVYSDFVKFRKVLKNEVRGIKNVYLKAIKAGEARMDVELQGNTRMLSEELMRKSFSNFGVNIFEIGQKQISLELVPKSATAPAPEIQEDAVEEENNPWSQTRDNEDQNIPESGTRDADR